MGDEETTEDTAMVTVCYLGVVGRAGSTRFVEGTDIRTVAVEDTEDEAVDAIRDHLAAETIVHLEAVWHNWPSEERYRERH